MIINTVSKLIVFQFGLTPLHLAVDRGYVELVKKLLGSGADPGVKDGVRRIWLTNVAATVLHILVMTSIYM